MEPIRVRSASDELLLLEVLAASGEDVLELPSLVAVDDEDDLAFITAESEGELAPVSSIVDLERLLFDGDDDTFVRPVIAESETADQWRIQTPTGSITSGEHSTESPTDTESSRSARKPSTHTRRRAKEELEYLREQVQELKLQLAALKHPLAAESDGPETPAESQPPMALHTELWKRVAERQLAAKERAEAENAKLRHMLEGQLRIAQSLAKVLRKRSDASWLEIHSTDAKRLRLAHASSDADTVFHSLFNEVETLADSLDAVILDAGLVDVSHTIEGGVIKTNAADNSVVLEVVRSNVVPFDFHRTAAAVWKLLSSLSMAIPNGVYQAIDATDNLLRAQFSLTMPFRRMEAVVTVRLVCKRIVEERREVLVWCSDGYSEGSLLGSERMGIHERSWSVIEPVGPHSQDGTASIMKSVVHTTPTLTETVRRSSPNERTYRVGVFTDVVLSAFHRNLAVLHQQIENILMSDDDD